MPVKTETFRELCRQFTYGIVREGVIAEIFPKMSAKFPQLSAEFPHPFLTQSNVSFANFRELSAEFPQTFRKNPFANDPISELLTMSAIGPYKFRGKFIWTNHWSNLFLGKFVWTNGPESSSKVSPYTGIGPWMALPSRRTSLSHQEAEGEAGVGGNLSCVIVFPYTRCSSLGKSAQPVR